jgi:hypothetical protein
VNSLIVRGLVKDFDDVRAVDDVTVALAPDRGARGSRARRRRETRTDLIREQEEAERRLSREGSSGAGP